MPDSPSIPVPFLDLGAQYDAIRGEVEPVLNEVVESQRFILGPQVEALESEMADYLEGLSSEGPGGGGGAGPSEASGGAGAPGLRAVGCASGTDALLLPLRVLAERDGSGGPGDGSGAPPTPGAHGDVVLPAFTFFATAGAVWNAGFRPVFCDVDPETFNVTRSTVEAAWTDRTRAVVPVHLFGQMAPVEEIVELARERASGGRAGAAPSAGPSIGAPGGRALVLEDCAQAVGAVRKGRAAGTVGDAGAFSFFPTKNLGGFGDGGLMTARDPDFAEDLARIRVHGGRKMYHHEMVGTNSRLDALQAAVLRVKLRHLDRWIRARGENACRYHGLLAGVDGVTLPATAEGNVHTYNQYTIRVEDRDGLREFLSRREIGSGVYYPVPLHLQECFRSLGYEEGDLPVSEALCREVLSLPIFPELGEERQQIVAAAIREYYGAC